jgi:hypothetical protein
MLAASQIIVKRRPIVIEFSPTSQRASFQEFRTNSPVALPSLASEKEMVWTASNYEPSRLPLSRAT